MAAIEADNLPKASLSDGKSVLVTGCSSGIGNAVALFLAEHGYTVFATVRKESDEAKLRDLKIPGLVPICPLDLSRPEQIPSVVEMVNRELAARGKGGLYAIVNNAGGGSIAPLELIDLNKFRIELEARIIGPIALLQHFLPGIRKEKGRIVWIVTPALMPISYVSSIHACDFAVNCLARTLDLELRPWKISNIMIRCGGIKTASPAKTGRELEESFKQWPREKFEPYSQAIRMAQEELSKFDEKRTEPGEVAKVIYRALCAKKPRRQYQIGYMAGVAAMVEYLPQSVIDYIMARRERS